MVSSCILPLSPDPGSSKVKLTAASEIASNDKHHSAREVAKVLLMTRLQVSYLMIVFHEPAAMILSADSCPSHAGVDLIFGVIS
jgi:hypothetical protein